MRVKWCEVGVQENPGDEVVQLGWKGLNDRYPEIAAEAVRLLTHAGNYLKPPHDHDRLLWMTAPYAGFNLGIGIELDGAITHLAYRSVHGDTRFPFAELQLTVRTEEGTWKHHTQFTSVPKAQFVATTAAEATVKGEPDKVRTVAVTHPFLAERLAQELQEDPIEVVRWNKDVDADVIVTSIPHLSRFADCAIIIGTEEAQRYDEVAPKLANLIRELDQSP